MDEGSASDEIEGLLRQEASRDVPQPPSDLAARTIRRVRNWILVGDLLRLVTLEALWRSTNGHDGGASGRRERQDS